MPEEFVPPVKVGESFERYLRKGCLFCEFDGKYLLSCDLGGDIVCGGDLKKCTILNDPTAAEYKDEVIGQSDEFNKAWSGHSKAIALHFNPVPKRPIIDEETE
jgi:hypothetical protein